MWVWVWVCFACMWGREKEVPGNNSSVLAAVACAMCSHMRPPHYLPRCTSPHLTSLQCIARLTFDWLQWWPNMFSAAEKATIRDVFVGWANDTVSGYMAPSPAGIYNDPNVLLKVCCFLVHCSILSLRLCSGTLLAGCPVHHLPLPPPAAPPQILFRRY